MPRCMLICIVLSHHVVCLHSCFVRCFKAQIDSGLRNSVAYCVQSKSQPDTRSVVCVSAAGANCRSHMHTLAVVRQVFAGHECKVDEKTLSAAVQAALYSKQPAVPVQYLLAFAIRNN